MTRFLNHIIAKPCRFSIKSVQYVAEMDNNQQPKHGAQTLRYRRRFRRQAQLFTGFYNRLFCAALCADQPAWARSRWPDCSLCRHKDRHLEVIGAVAHLHHFSCTLDFCVSVRVRPIRSAQKRHHPIRIRRFRRELPVAESLLAARLVGCSAANSAAFHAASVVHDRRKGVFQDDVDMRPPDHFDFRCVRAKNCSPMLAR